MRLESFGGMVLCAAAAVAVVMANTRLGAHYAALLDVPIVVQVGSLAIAKPLLLWVNDGLMAIFFLVVGLEVKRAVLAGELSSVSSAVLPAVAAVGGMLGPVLVYVACNWTNAAALRGWAIPAATDIAFALGVLALLGRRAPPSLKIFLLALAIIDDLGAIIIIAVFYTDDLSVVALALAGAGVVALAALNLAGVTRRSAYLLVGVGVWVCVLKSGIHATLAGVAVGLAVPLHAASGESPLQSLEHDLHPWVAFAILPLFAFANAGVGLTDIALADLLDPIQLGIGLGLFLGKQIGVVGSVWIVVRLGVGTLPAGASWRQVYGTALLTGVGFTMSLFVGTLAFPADGYDADIRIAVLLGSLASAVAGYLVLRTAPEIPTAP